MTVDTTHTHRAHETLLMWLPPDDESKAMEVAQLLLEHGADPTCATLRG